MVSIYNIRKSKAKRGIYKRKMDGISELMKVDKQANDHWKVSVEDLTSC